MRVTPEKKVGQGGFANVWRGTDELGRTVAIKILGPSAAAMMGAHEHAKPLAKVDHPNVVRVFSIETIDDPEGGGEVECVVMEYVPGPTLEERAQQAPLSLQELRAIGSQLTDALRAIHDVGIAHRDLHEANVILGPSGAKVIDVFYRGTLAEMRTHVREATLANDVDQLIDLIRFAIKHSELGPEIAATFHRTLRGTKPDFERVCKVFLDATDITGLTHVDSIDPAYTRLVEPGFVGGEEYAGALIDEIPSNTDKFLLLRLVENGSFRPEHRHLVGKLWQRMSEAGKAEVIGTLANKINTETPGGKYKPHLGMLAALGETGWKGLPVTSRLRLEKLILEDLRQAKRDVYGMRLFPAGHLATFVKSLWVRLNQAQLIEILSLKLSSDWYSQNYVAHHFMAILPKLGREPKHKAQLIAGLKRAHKNESLDVQANFSKLPKDWQDEITKAP
jgi:serine/threonine protein kinase